MHLFLCRNSNFANKDKELDEKQVCSFFEHTSNDGKSYKTQFYNLDMIIYVGYRVKSK